MRKKRHLRVKTNSISEVRNAVNYLIEIFDIEQEGEEKGEREVRKLVVTKEGKLRVYYDEEK